MNSPVNSSPSQRSTIADAAEPDMDVAWSVSMYGLILVFYIFSPTRRDRVPHAEVAPRPGLES